MADEAETCEQRHDGGDTAAFSRDALSSDRIYEVLAHERRRYLCYLLCDRSEIHLDEAVASIGEWESDDQSPDERRREHIRLALLHNHIPKLRERDVVEFDSHSRTLVTDDAEAVLTALQAVGQALYPADGDRDDGESA